MFEKSIYLCGSMSGMKSLGAGWRKDLQPWLEKKGLKVFNPCKEELKMRDKYKLKDLPLHDWEKLPQILQEEIMEKDLEQIWFRTRFVVCYFTKYSTGTVSELSYALLKNIPVYFVTNRRLKGWPGTVARKEGNKRFRTFAELKRFLTVKYALHS